MPFKNNYQGDPVSLDYIVETVRANRLLIPGITVHANPQILGGSGFIYTKGKRAGGKGVAGDRVDYKSTGGKRIDFLINKALHLNSVIPHVNSATVGADIIMTELIQETIYAMNDYNHDGIDIMEKAAAKKTATGNGAYEKIVNALAEFKTDNKDRQGRPVSAIVSSKFYSELLKDPNFIRASELGDKVVASGIVGQIAGLMIVESTNLTADFMLIDPAGVVAPISINSTSVVDATAAGWPNGTLIAGELVYGVKVVDNTEDENLGDGYYVSAYTAA